MYTSCHLCERRCGIDRSRGSGVCGVSEQIKLALAAPHYYEEPPISGTRGSGAIFFSGCSLGCVFCQNYNVSHRSFGEAVSVERLAAIMLELQEQGVHNINLVTPTHYIPSIIKALEIAKPQLSIPIVYNTSTYESKEALAMLEGYIDIYLPDLKFCAQEVSKRYIGREDYFSVASRNVKEMLRQVGAPILNEDGLLQKGVLIRHLVMPSLTKDSLLVLDFLEGIASEDKFYLSLMGQYLPFGTLTEYPEINRRLHPLEYSRVKQRVEKIGFQGFLQGLDSASSQYTPTFDLRGVRC